MGNLLQYTDRSRSIDKKLQELLSNIEHERLAGNIKTETEYYYRIKNAVSDFYKSLGRPLFTFRPAEYAPISEHYNSMVSESISDMKYIMDDCTSLSSKLDNVTADNELWQKMAQAEMSYMEKQVEEISENAAKNVSEGVAVFSEFFNNTKQQQNPTSNERLQIDTENHILTLGYSRSNRADIGSVEIDASASNGLPGNSHCVDTKNMELHYMGQDGLHKDVSAIIDSSHDSWFEFELFDISEAVRELTNNYGFSYEEGISWLGKPPLVLKMTLNVSSSHKTSWITINPYLPEVKGVKPFTAGDCTIISVDGNVYKVCESIDMNGIKLFTYPACNVKEVRLTFYQDAGYPVYVGHTYYTKVNSKLMSIFQDYDTSDVYARVEGQMPSVTALGVKYNPETQWVEYNSEDMSATYAKSILFNHPVSTADKTCRTEIIEAERYMIGIRDISLKSHDFYESGKYISKPFTTDKPIDSIILEAYEYIPGTDPEVLQYYITFDSGINWHQIYPVGRSYAGVYKYTMNNDSISNMLTTREKLPRTKNVNILRDVYSIQLMITMRRPEGIENPENTSPVVYGYKLHIETGGENIEY